MTEVPKIFISYSWTTPQHEDWVISLAEKLMSDGVEVRIDKWDLKEGHDSYSFMESMVKSPEIQKVLLVLDKKYSEKANARSGGVGTETQIISPKIYGDVSQEKFIPIIAEKDDYGIPFIPTYLEGRIYIDLSDENTFEENYEKVLRNIFQRPAYSKPKIGKAPSYLFEETPMTHKTSNLLRSFDNQISKTPQRVNAITREFFDDFFEDLKGYSVDLKGSTDIIFIGKTIHDTILSYTALRNDYIVFLIKLFKSELDFDIDILIRFFERLPILKEPEASRASWMHSEFDNFRFFIHELFLYTIAVGLKFEKYRIIAEILYSGYFFQNRNGYKKEAQRFDELYSPVEIFDRFYKQTYSKNHICPMADLIIKRMNNNLKNDDIVDADLLLHYIATLEKLRWFPMTYVYKAGDLGSFELFHRLVSMRHFEKIKVLFHVTSVKELQSKIQLAKEEESHTHLVGYSQSFDRVVPIYKLIDIDKIGSLR